MDGHYSQLKGKWQRCDDCFKIYLNKHTCNENRCSYVSGMLRKNKVKPKKIKEVSLKNKYICHYDIETYRNKINIHEPYIVGCVYEDTNGLCVYKTFVNKDCMKQFYNFMHSDEMQHIKFVYAYNGSRFTTITIY